MNVFKRSSQLIKGPLSVVFLILYVVLAVIAIGLFIEDYSTSLMGYKMWPTAKANPWVIYLVALLPQLGTLGFLYAFMDDTEQRWRLGLAVALHVVDVISDVWFKMMGTFVFPDSFPLLLAALLETELLYTVGSELLLALSVGMVLRLFPQVMDYLGIGLGSGSTADPRARSSTLPQ